MTSAREMLRASGISEPESVWADFLTTIHGDAEGLIDVRAIREGRRPHRFECETIDEACARIAEHLDWNVYVGIAKRRLTEAEFASVEAEREADPKRRRKPGGKHNLSQLSALWLDWDPTEDRYEHPDESRGHREEVEMKLETIDPCPPNLIIWSGAGLHCYWLLEEPEDISTPDRVACVENTLRGLCSYIGADPASTDASRILRVPATINYPDEKKRAKGRVTAPCVIHQPDDGRRC